MRSFLILGACVLGVAATAAGSDARVSFNRDIRPIMADTCFRCHGPDKSSRMVGLRLDVREEALRATKSKVTPIVPGSPEKSAIIERIFSSSPARIMPPKYAHKELTAAQKETIRRWVAEGAEYEGHWAYSPVRRPAVPELRNPARNPVDAFILDRLAREGLTASAEADRRTLLRRVTLDLTGLPPSPEELRAFLNDSSPDAYEKVVNRLLASPRYAEKQTVHWLDAVRYADTCGFHGDNPFPAWPYRDYVLRAFRDNKPFDQFTREQLAGDLIPDSATEQLVASAYNRLNRTSAEGGIQPKEYLAKYGADRVRTTSSVWLGSTMGCAECHDHKFDPFLSKDFYSMKAFFADIRETGLVPDRGPEAWGALLSLPSAEQRRRVDEMDAKVLAARQKLEEKRAGLAATLPGWTAETLKRYEAGELSWKFQRPVAARGAKGAKLTVYNDQPVESTYDARGSLVTERKPGNGLIVASGPNPDNETYTVTLKPGAGTWTALGVEMVADESLPGIRVARGGDRLVVTEIEATVSPDGVQPARKVPFVLATSSLSFPLPELPAMAAIDGDPKTGWGVATYGDNRVFLAVRFAGPVGTTVAGLITVRFRHDSEYRRATMGRFRVALSTARHSWPGADGMAQEKPSGLPDRILKAMRIPAEKRTSEQTGALQEHYCWTSEKCEPELAALFKAEADRGLLEAAIPKVVYTQATIPSETRILPRGNFLDESGEVVEPAIPAFLGKLETGGRRATRLDLANWIVSKDNPLTARVFVNRMWRQFFGTGLSKALDDLGSQGEWPTHPELLDWLAAEFMRPEYQAAGAHEWDVKHLARLMVTSHTYRQSSLGNAQADAKDPDNRLLSRQNRMRVDAEAVRDIALAVAGLLSERFGGPSVRPYQPEGYLGALNFPKRDYSASRGSDLYRRSVYTQWQRSFLHPSLVTFDAPTREECTVNRVNSNTPLQALVLLNDPIFVEAARVFAQKMLSEGGPTFEKRLNWAFLRALGREPSAEERQILAGLHQASLAKFSAAPAAARQFLSIGEAPLPAAERPVELAALATVARALLNLHETITRN